jgi:hypothetical protein
MERHPYFDLWLHTPAELNELLPAPICERATLHEWPLSCVQKLRLANGQQMIYKAQFVEGVEPEFYARAKSPLLPAFTSLGSFENTSAALIEHLPAPRLKDLALTEAEACTHADRLGEAIRQIEGNPPVYRDLGSPQHWLDFAAETGCKLEQLVLNHDFERVSLETIQSLAGWAGTPAVLAEIVSAPGLAHADLTPDNVFITPDGYRIIDWQYPRRAPASFDRVTFLMALGLNASRFASPAAVQIVHFVRLGWYVDCAARLFPAGRADYDRYIARLAGEILQAA